MKKRTLLLLPTLALVFSLSACKGGNTDPKPSDQGDSGQHEDIPPEGGGGEVTPPEPEPEVVTLVGISLSGTHKTEFELEEEFSYAGLIVTAAYSNSTTKVVTPTSVSTPDMSTAGTKTVTVSYTEGEVTKTATYSIVVNERETPPSPPVPELEYGYYLVGTKTNWTYENAPKLSAGSDGNRAQLLNYSASAGEKFKVKSHLEGQEEDAWYGYGVEGEHKDIEGNYVVGTEDKVLDIYVGADGGLIVNVQGEEPPALEYGYYLVGTKSNWSFDNAPKLSEGTDGNRAQILGYEASAGEKFKVRSHLEGQEEDAWYGYGVEGDHKDTDGNYVVGTEDKVLDIYVGADGGLIVNVQGEEPPAPTFEDGYYLIGSETGWEVDADYKMTTPTEGDDLAQWLGYEAKALEEFKVYSQLNGVTRWYGINPTEQNPEGDNYVVAEDSTLNIYVNNGGALWVEVVGGDTPVDPVDPEIEYKTLYLNANGIYDADDAYLFAHAWDENGGLDYKLELVEGQECVYSAEINKAYNKVVFVRQNTSETEIDWEDYWNKTIDLDIPEEDNPMYVVTSLEDGITSGEWSTYDAEQHYEPAVTPEPPVDPVDPTETKTIYLNANGIYDVDDAKLFAHAWYGEDEGTMDYALELVEGQECVYKVEVSKIYTNILFVRQSEGETLDWGKVWNQTENLSVPSDDKDMYVITGLEEGVTSGEWAVYDANMHYEPAVTPVDPVDPVDPEEVPATAYRVVGLGDNWVYDEGIALDVDMNQEEVEANQYKYQYSATFSVAENDSFKLFDGTSGWLGADSENFSTNSSKHVIGVTEEGHVGDILVNKSGEVKVYLKVYNDDALGIHVQFTPTEPDPEAETKTFTVNCEGSWVLNDVDIFAYVWGGEDGAKWIKCTVGEGNVTFESKNDIQGFLLVRVVEGTETPSWSTTGNEKGRIYNKTRDVDFVEDTYEYSLLVTDWVEHNPS